MAIVYEERDGKRYAYECTSRRVPGKKNPVSSKTYLGAVDARTGDIIPKKIIAAKGFPEKIYTKNLGGVLLADKVQKDLFISDDLEKAFGNRWRDVLSLAAAQTVVPGPFSNTQLVLEDSYIPELYGVRENADPRRVSEMLTRIGRSGLNMDEFFELRTLRTKDTLIYDITSVSSHSRMGGWSEFGYNRDGESMRQVNIGLVTDREGIPVSFELFPGSISDVTTLGRMASDVLRRGGKECIIVMDKGFESPRNMIALCRGGMKFITMIRPSVKMAKEMLSRLSPAAGDTKYDRFIDGRVYTVVESRFSVEEEDDDAEYIEDPNGNMVAYICRDPVRAAESSSELKVKLDSLIRELNGLAVRDPQGYLEKKAHGLEKYIDIGFNENGGLSLSIKTKALARAVNRAGSFILIASEGISWEQSMRSYDTREKVEKAFDTYKTCLDGKRLRTGDPDSARGRFFVKMIALMIRIRIENIISSSKRSDLTTDNVLESLSNLRAVGGEGMWMPSETTKRNRGILEMFGIAVPKEL